MTDADDGTDWTAGTPRLLHGECRGCGRRWSLPRERCPGCGGDDTVHRPCAGRGRVAAVSVVHRAPTGGVHPETPFGLCLVDLEEGVRVMGRGRTELAVGDHVVVGFPAGVPEFRPTDPCERTSGL